MNRKILSITALVLATAVAAPLAQARDRDGRDGWNSRDDRRPAPVYREKHVEKHHYYYPPGQRRGWNKPGHPH